MAIQPRRPVIEILDPLILEILRKQTPEQRLKQAFNIWNSARVIVGGAVRQQHPEFTEEQVMREIARRLSHGATERVPR